MQKTISRNIVDKLIELGLTISTCESITGGAIASNLVLNTNASKCFLGSLVTYSKASKVKLAKCDQSINNDNVLYSFETSKQLANAAYKAFNSDITIGITGQAPGVSYITIYAFDKYNNFEFKSTYDNKVDCINQNVAFVYNKIWDLIGDLHK